MSHRIQFSFAKLISLFDWTHVFTTIAVAQKWSKMRDDPKAHQNYIRDSRKLLLFYLSDFDFRNRIWAAWTLFLELWRSAWNSSKQWVEMINENGFGNKWMHETLNVWSSEFIYPMWSMNGWATRFAFNLNYTPPGRKMKKKITTIYCATAPINKSLIYEMPATNSANSAWTMNIEH